jgi:hypothetical protein
LPVFSGFSAAVVSSSPALSDFVLSGSGEPVPVSAVGDVLATGLVAVVSAGVDEQAARASTDPAAMAAAATWRRRTGYLLRLAVRDSCPLIIGAETRVVLIRRIPHQGGVQRW